MEVNGDDEYSVSKSHGTDQEEWHENRPEVPHKSFLEECFRKQIGYAIERPQNIDIYTYTNKRVAKGYQQVVTTCQGMYYEMKKEQVNWRQFKDTRLTVGGDRCWRAEGVTVYQPQREVRDKTIVPHRFALNPTKETPRKTLRRDRFYIHVYQTRIGYERRTLRSKGISRELSRRFGKMYWPREMDKQWGEHKPKETRRRVTEPERSKTRGTRRQNVWDNSRRSVRSTRTKPTGLNHHTRQKNGSNNR